MFSRKCLRVQNACRKCLPRDNPNDEPVLEIAEVHVTSNYQRREFGKKGAQIRKENLVRKLYEGGLYDLRASHGLERSSHYIQVLEILLRVPTWIDLDIERQATVKAELADKGSTQDVTKRLPMHRNVSTEVLLPHFPHSVRPTRLRHSRSRPYPRLHQLAAATRGRRRHCS